MSFLTESPLTAYAILGVGAAVCIFAFAKTQRVKFLAYAGALAALALLVAGIDYLVETDREQVARRTYEFVKAAEVGDLDRFATYVSDDFYSLSLNKSAFLGLAKTYLIPVETRRFHVGNLQVLDSKRAPGRELDALFSAKSTGSFRGYEDYPVRIELAFKKEADGQWRIRSFRLLQAMTDQELPLPR